MSLLNSRVADLRHRQVQVLSEHGGMHRQGPEKELALEVDC